MKSTTLSIPEQLHALESLQELDLQLDRVRAEQSSIPAALQAIDDSIALLEKKSADSGARIATHEQAAREAKGEGELNADRLARSTSRMEGVQNEHELKSIEKEVFQLKAAQAKFDEIQKLAAAEIANLSAQRDADLNGINSKREERAEREQAGAGRSEKLRAELAVLEGKRAEIAPRIEPRVVAMYNRVRGMKGGIGISPALASRCKACNMAVPPQTYNELLRGTVFHQCATCHRFLYIPRK